MSTLTKPTKKKQRSKRGEKKAHDPSQSCIEAFFANYAPRFQHNPTASASLEFYRLCDEFGWHKEHPKRITAHQKFKDALVKQFNAVYGTNVGSLANWQNLCHIVHIDPVPKDLHACREAVRYSFINLVDLVDTHKTGVQVEVFKSERELSEYTLRTHKFFPKENAYAGGLLRYLLRRIYHPREGYACREGHRGRKRR